MGGGFALAEGIVELNCGDHRLDVIDPEQGGLVQSLAFEESYSSGSGTFFSPMCSFIDPLNNPDEPELVRRQFDEDFSSMAVVSEELPDGSVHVGYVDLATGQVTNITEQFADDSFSAETPIHQDPGFGPDGTFRYTDANSGGGFEVDLDSESSRYDPAITSWGAMLGEIDPFLGNGSGNGTTWFFSTGAICSLSAVRGLSTRDGAFLTHLETDAFGKPVLSVRIPGGRTYKPCLPLSDFEAGHYVDQSTFERVYAEGDETAVPCVPRFWVDARQIVCEETDDTNRFAVVDVLSLTREDQYVLVPQAPVIWVPAAPNSRSNSQPIVSPSGSQVAFYSVQGEEVAIYTAEIGAPETVEPELVVDRSFEGTNVLLWWQ